MFQGQTNIDASDSREALYDFNKLVVGTGETKLFIAPQTHDDEAFRDCLLPAAKCCSGEVYLAFLRHQKDWKQQRLSVHLLRCTGDAWREM